MDTSRSPWEENDFPFCKAMDGLAKTLHPMVGAADTGQAVELPKPSRAEQFRRKWNWGQSNE